MPLTDADNEDLIKKNKKKKTLGSINLKVTMSPITKEEMNEVCISAIITIVSFIIRERLLMTSLVFWPFFTGGQTALL